MIHANLTRVGLLAIALLWLLLVPLAVAVQTQESAAYDTDTTADITAFNAGYDARYKHDLPQTANPYPIPLKRDRDLWNTGWGWRGWMPDWREKRNDS